MQIYIFFSVSSEHTTGLCKSYEDKHSALQDKLRETSLRCEYSGPREKRDHHQKFIFRPSYVIHCTVCFSEPTEAKLRLLAGGLHTRLQ